MYVGVNYLRNGRMGNLSKSIYMSTLILFYLINVVASRFS